MLPSPKLKHRSADMLNKIIGCVGCLTLGSRTALLLQVASCSVHHSGALLLEVRDGEFLDARLCSTCVASSSHLQQPDTEYEAAFQASRGPQEVDNFVKDGPEGFGNEYDDGGGGGDDGDDYMHQEAIDQHDDAMPGGLSCQVVSNAGLHCLCCRLYRCTLHNELKTLQAAHAEHVDGITIFLEQHGHIHC